METAKENVEKVTHMLESGFITIKTKAEEKLFPQLPEGTTANIQAKIDTAKEKVTSAVDSLDSLACVGLDQLTFNVPALIYWYDYNSRLGIDIIIFRFKMVMET